MYFGQGTQARHRTRVPIFVVFQGYLQLLVVGLSRFRVAEGVVCLQEALV